jgi:pimeloyl-ACP methyl ester carboxylesterase
MMASFIYDGLKFHFRELGSGVPFLFQHGLGADLEQPLGIFTPPKSIRLIAFDCRFHGQTDPNGPAEKVALDTFAQDMAALVDHLQVGRAIVGGISMGAAVALKFALGFPARVLGLVQSRPAWLVGPNWENAGRFGLVADLLQKLGPVRGKQEFLTSNVYHDLARESPDAAESLCGQFDKPWAVERAARLERIPRDTAIASLSELSAVKIPTLVLSSRHDPIHPFQFGQSIAEAIPSSTFREITAKSVCRKSYEAEVQENVAGFLQERFL